MNVCRSNLPLLLHTTIYVLPNMNCMIIVTAAHCVYRKDLGGYAKKITVTFPGQAGVTATTDDLYAPPEWRENQHDNFDYGMIHLPGNCDVGFGWSSFLTGAELQNRSITSCGFSDDKPKNTMWITGQNISKVTDHSIEYSGDAFGGNSGGPMYTWYKGYWTVIAIHVQGDRPNAGTRISSSMIYRFLDTIGNLKKYNLESVQFPNVYIRCAGSGVDHENSPGGVINCQYIAGPYERFYIYPVEVTPSLALEQAYVVAIRSVQFPNANVHLNGASMSHAEPQGGGVVNCQFSGLSVSRSEAFLLGTKVDGHYHFRSEEFSNCYIRLDGRGVTKFTGPGGGTVNCQYGYAGPYEVFYMKEIKS